MSINIFQKVGFSKLFCSSDSKYWKTIWLFFYQSTQNSTFSTEEVILIFYFFQKTLPSWRIRSSTFKPKQAPFKSTVKLFAAWIVAIPHSSILPRKFSARKSGKNQPTSRDSTSIESPQLIHKDKLFCMMLFRTTSRVLFL